MPENWVSTYNQWMNNIQDWCISRQLVGPPDSGLVRRRGNVIVAKCGRAQAQAPGKRSRCDEDVLDTWYS